MASQITSQTISLSWHQSSTSPDLFRTPVNKGPVTQNVLPFHDIAKSTNLYCHLRQCWQICILQSLSFRYHWDNVDKFAFYKVFHFVIIPWTRMTFSWHRIFKEFMSYCADKPKFWWTHIHTTRRMQRQYPEDQTGLGWKINFKPNRANEWSPSQYSLMPSESYMLLYPASLFFAVCCRLSIMD